MADEQNLSDAMTERDFEAVLQQHGVAVQNEDGTKIGGHSLTLRHLDSDDSFEAQGDTRLNALKAALVTALSKGF